MRNTHREVLHLVELQVLFTFFKLCRWCQIMHQILRITKNSLTFDSPLLSSFGKFLVGSSISGVTSHRLLRFWICSGAFISSSRRNIFMSGICCGKLISLLYIYIYRMINNIKIVRIFDHNVFLWCLSLIIYLFSALCSS